MYQKSKIFNFSNFSFFSFNCWKFENPHFQFSNFKFFQIFPFLKKSWSTRNLRFSNCQIFSFFPVKNGYFFPRSFLRFSYASRLRMSCCWWMRKEIRGGVQPGAVVRYPLRTTTWKTEEAEGIHRRRELVFTSPFVSSSWIICRTDLLVVSFL